MKRYISVGLCMLLLIISFFSFSHKSYIGAYEKTINTPHYKAMAMQPNGLLVVAAFVIGFYNGYMDTKKEYGQHEASLNAYYDEKDFSGFDN